MPEHPRSAAERPHRAWAPVRFLQEHWREIADAWRLPAVRRGCYGSALIALGAFSPAYLPRSSPFWRMLAAINAEGTPAKVIGTLVTVLGAFLLVDAWIRVRPRQVHSGQSIYRDFKHWAVLVIWGAPLLLAPPVFSHDAYSYAAQGWLVHNLINPYDVGPGVLPGGFADQVAWVWRFTRTPYGPLSLQIQHALVDLSGYQPYLSAVLMRVPALLGVVLIGLLLPRIATQMRLDPALAAWFGVANPLLVINFIGGAHNDALMVGLMVVGLWLARWPGPGRAARLNGWWWLAGSIMIGVAATIKQPAFLAAYAVPLIARAWYSWQLREVLITAARVLISFALAIGTFVLITWATGLGFGWVNAVNVPGMVVTVSPFTLLGLAVQQVLNLFGLDATGHAAIRISRTIGLACGAVLITIMAFTIARRRPVSFLSWGYLTVAFCAPALHSWYVLWGGTLLPLTRMRAGTLRLAVWTTLVLLSYDAINMSWRNDAVAIGIAAMVGFWWLARSHSRVLDSDREALLLAPGTGISAPEHPAQQHGEELESR